MSELLALPPALLRPENPPHLRIQHIHLPPLLQHRPLPCPQLAIPRQRIRAFRRRRHHVLQVDYDAQRVAQRFQGEADAVDGGHAAVLAAADHDQQVAAVDPDAGLHALQRAHGGAGGFMVDRARRVGQMHGAHHVLVHRVDVALHRALVAGQSGGFDAGEVAGGGERVGRAGLLRSAGV